MLTEHGPNCAIFRMGNIRSWCDCGLGDDGMKWLYQLNDRQLISRARNMYEDNPEIISWWKHDDYDDYEHQETVIQLTGLYNTMTELANRLDLVLGQKAILEEALKGATQALGEVE